MDKSKFHDEIRPGIFADMVAGTMGPQVSLRLRWRSFEDYLASQRSAYRHRLLRLGGTYTPLRALVRHSSPLMHLGCRLSMPFLACKPVPEKFRVFRDDAPR